MRSKSRARIHARVSCNWKNLAPYQPSPVGIYVLFEREEVGLESKEREGGGGGEGMTGREGKGRRLTKNSLVHILPVQFTQNYQLETPRNEPLSKT